MNTKFVILALGTITAVALFGLKMYIDNGDSGNSKLAKIARKINSNPESTWTANENIPAPLLLQSFKKQFNLIVEKTLPKNFDKAPEYLTAIYDLPQTLDLREKYPKCEAIKEIRDQSACGSCWAFGAASAMSDRLCIASGQKDQRKVSAEDLMECCSSCGDGCNGGYLYQSWSYWKEKGLVTGDIYGDKNSCKPYQFPPCNHHSSGPYDDCSKHDYDAPVCKAECWNKNYKIPYAKDKIFGKSVYEVTSENQMMQELNSYGSIEVAFSVYEDFLLYKSGVYKHQTGGFLGGHAVKIIGYGVENGTKFWLVVNSWNTNWGDKGTFKIIRGIDHCGIESQGVAGLVKI